VLLVHANIDYTEIRNISTSKTATKEKIMVIVFHLQLSDDNNQRSLKLGDKK
jgi:hypothetical protein